MVGAVSETSPTALYNKLTKEEQNEFNTSVIEKLKTLIGFYGELSVLAEYIAVMLQSSRPPEQIQSELEAFLQGESVPFTNWLCDQLVEFNRRAGAQQDSQGEAMLLRAVRDARQGAEGGGRKRDKVERAQTRREKRARTAAVPAPAAAPEPAPTAVAAAAPSKRLAARSRSRQRLRRRRVTDAEGHSKRVTSHRDRDAQRGVVLTPNVEFLRDAYHQKTRRGPDEPAIRADEVALQAEPIQQGVVGDDTRWHFRANPTPGPPPATFVQLAPAPGAAPPMPAPRPRHFEPKKWRVVRAETVVRGTMMLESDKVQLLKEGEIVEQVAPQCTLKNGIVRIQIRHPSSPQFPNPIGWVTLDATAAGGPKLLEPGPEPMARPSWRPPAPASQWNPVTPWRPEHAYAAPGSGPRPRPAIPSAPRGPTGFQNLTWKPSNHEGPGPTVALEAGGPPP